MISAKRKKLLKTQNIFEFWFYSQYRHWDGPKGKNIRANRDLATLHVLRKSLSEPKGRAHLFITDEDRDYLIKLHKYIEFEWDGTSYEMKDKEVILMKNKFDKKWLADGKKIPFELPECIENGAKTYRMNL